MSKLSNFWIESYRPKTLDDLCISEGTKSIIKSFGKDMPNLLFVGPAGGGKTSLAQILVKDILKCDYIYVNASDENGIDNIRNKVSGFAQTKSFDGELKVIILDESDFLSTSAQAALRNVMETYAGTTRFILTGNYRHKIIPALQSRCQSIDINPELKDAFKRCSHILDKEKIETSMDQKKLLVQLVKKHFPDLRKCINEMQKYCINGVLSITNKVDTSELMGYIYTNIKNSKSIQTRKYLIENDVLFNGDHEQLLSDLLNYYYDLNIPDTEKKQSILTIADYLFKITHVSDREICAIACILQLENL